MAVHSPHSPGSREAVQAAHLAFTTALHQARQRQIGQWLAPASAGAPAPGLPTRRHYALVSAGQCHAVDPASLLEAHGLDHEQLFLQTPEADMADAGPWLIALPPARDASLLSALSAQACDDALTLLASPIKLAPLAAHLRSFLHARLEGGDEDVPVLLRYFDPRIGFDAVEHWPAEARRAFLQPMTWWAGWDAQGQARRLSGPGRTAPMRHTQPMRLSRAWSDALATIGAPQLAAALLAEELEETRHPDAHWMARMHPLLQRGIAREAMDFATGAGLVTWNEHLTACRQALLTHAAFHTHPALAKALAAPPSQSDSAESAPPTLDALLTTLPASVRHGWLQDRDAALIRSYEARTAAMTHALSKSTTA